MGRVPSADLRQPRLRRFPLNQDTAGEKDLLNYSSGHLGRVPERYEAASGFSPLYNGAYTFRITMTVIPRKKRPQQTRPILLIQPGRTSGGNSEWLM